MKIQLGAFLVVVASAFLAGTEGFGEIQWDEACDWKPSGTVITGCNGQTTNCSQGCNTVCNGFAKVEYKKPQTISSGGSGQKTTNQVSLTCKINKNCGNASPPKRRCVLNNGFPDCSTVDVTTVCTYCKIDSANTVGANGYNLRGCPASP